MDEKPKQKDPERNYRRSRGSHLLATIELLASDPEIDPEILEKAERVLKEKRMELKP